MEDQFYKIPAQKTFDFQSKKMLCVVKKDQFEEAEEKTLTSISQAIKINYSQDVEVLILELGEKLQIGSSLNKFDVVIYFGVNPADTGLNIDAKLYRIFKLEGPSVLVSHHLRDIAADKNKKLFLWKCLQPLFGIG